MKFSKELIEKIWYSSHLLGIILAPLGWLYTIVIIIRHFCYQAGLITVNQVNAPVIIVGNISIGGTGKTPLVIWLANYFKEKGFNPGIISRGYGGKRAKCPQQVRFDSNPATVGDEPVLIARNTSCPVAVASQRHKAAEELITHCDCDLILCDDGLQHYSLARDLEIAVIDGHQRFGNRRCLPAGPLREPVSRLKHVDLTVSKDLALRHEFKMNYVYSDLVSVSVMPKRTRSLKDLIGKPVHAVAGIGNPEHFFRYLRSQGINIIEHEFADHYAYTAKDIQFNDGLSVVLTEKDAVKCIEFAGEQHWFLPIKANVPRSFSYRLDTLMERIINAQKTT